MEVQKEAQRIMTLSVWKMYHSRLQRGGLRLHRSLQLSLVMRSARELYLSAKVEAQEPEVAGRPSDPRLLLLASPPATEAAAAAAAAAAGTAEAAPPDGEPPSPEPMDTEDNKEEEAAPRPARASRKRRSSSRLNDGGLVPSKKARLEEEEEEEEEEGMVVAAAAEEEEEEEAAARLQPAAPAEGAFPNLARVLQRSFSGLLHRSPGGPPTAAPAPCEATPACRPPDSMLNVLVRAVVAF